MREITYGVAPIGWKYNEIYGNHRFIVEAPRSEYVRVLIPWRRRDPLFDGTGVIVRYETDKGSPAVGDGEVKNVFIEHSEKDQLSLIFSSPREGEYQIYYIVLKDYKEQNI